MTGLQNLSIEIFHVMKRRLHIILPCNSSKYAPHFDNNLYFMHMRFHFYPVSSQNILTDKNENTCAK